MLAVLSPSKSLRTNFQAVGARHSQPVFLKEAETINRVLRCFDPAGLMELQGVSEKLARLNVERNLLWQTPFTTENAQQAAFMFSGDVYEGFQAASLTKKQLENAQEKIRILSGLYGLLRPLDLIRPYRLEMGTRLKVGRHSDLYDFWQKKVTATLNREVEEKGGVLVNLASEEYFRAIDTRKIKGKIITPVFREYKGGQYRVVSFYAKKARGLMARFIAAQNLSVPETLKAFDLEGYRYRDEMTEGSTWVFTRG